MTTTLIPLAQMPLRARHWYIFVVASLEQLIGAALSTIAGVIIPLILLLGTPHLSAAEQGILGASGLIGIAVGSVIIGKLMDSMGYLVWFRLCPLIIAVGAAGVYVSDSFWPLAACLFVIGLGVGGGYSLDSGYISEIMPTRWESFFVGMAKATSSVGFVGGAAWAYFLLKADPSAAAWPDLILFVGVLGVIAFLLRLRWYQSPRWLMARGETEKAQAAARDFLGPDAEVLPLPEKAAGAPVSWGEMFRGENLEKVIFSGISWACEGLGVYGFGVFLPILVMALGLQGDVGEGVPKVLDSVRTTAFINIFIGAGFALGLAVLHKVNSVRLMGWSFVLCALSLAVLWGGHQWGWPVWVSFLAFVVFETALNAGPHLITFIIPSRIYPVAERGAGMGIAAMLGKVGAILGVFFMPVLLSWGGITAVLLVSIVVQLVGAAVTFIYGKRLKLV